jgi:hypothetical protein
VLTLGLGVGANTAIFSVVQSVLLRPLPYRQPESLIQVWNTYFPTFPKLELSPGDYQDLRRQPQSFSEVAGYVSIAQGFNLTGARLALAGVVIGLIGTFALTRLIASMLFGVQPNDAVSFAGMAFLLISIALLACYVPARRAMRLDPVVALRHE